MRKIILDFYEVLDEYIDEIPEKPDEKDDDPGKTPKVFLADMPENHIKGYRELIHDYLRDQFDFPDYYGKNLDALYECLTDITEPTAVGFFIPVPDFDDLSLDFMIYLEKVKRVFMDAERDNGDYLAVICADNDEYFDSEEEDPDAALSDLFSAMRFE